MNPIALHRQSQSFGTAPIPETPLERKLAPTPRHSAENNDTPTCTEVRAMTMRLDQAIGRAGSNDPDAFVTLCLADLRQMDRWGVTIRGETLWSYFDLGSIDDVEPRYPVTLDEARLLRRAVAALDHDRCQPIRRSRRWRGTV